MALEVEGIIDDSIKGEKTLRRHRRLETLHLSSSDRPGEFSDRLLRCMPCSWRAEGPISRRPRRRIATCRSPAPWEQSHAF